MKTVYGNPSSLHRLGFDAEKLVTQSRKQIAGALSCYPDELYFTSGATESNNLAIRGLTGAYPRHRTKNCDNGDRASVGWRNSGVSL